MARELADVEQRQRDRQLRLTEEGMYGGPVSEQDKGMSGTLGAQELDDRRAAVQYQKERDILGDQRDALGLMHTRPDDLGDPTAVENRIMNEMLGIESGGIRDVNSPEYATSILHRWDDTLGQWVKKESAQSPQKTRR
jgi:hypothetical protein